MAAPAKLLYRLLNLPHNVVVQKTYVGSTYVYALQLTDGQTNAVISRAPKPASGYDVDYTGCESMTLENFGHGQTWEYYEHNGNDYWIVATKPNASGWATQIGRVKFEATTHTNNTSITRLAELNHATTGAAYEMYRVEGALSTDKATLLIAGIDTSGVGHMALYNNEALNNLMDEVDSTHGYVDLSKHSEAMIDAYAIPDIRGTLVTRSVQGFDLSNGNAIYISSGQAYSSEHTTHDTPGITKFFWNHTTGEKVELYNTNWKPTDSDTWTQNVEAEGVQIATDDMYLDISYHTADGSSTTENRVYYIPKTYWS